MPKTRPFSELADKIPDTPERRLHAARFRRAMDTATALGELLDEEGGATRIDYMTHEEDEYLSALRNYVELLEGRLEINAVFPDRTVTLVPEEN